MDQTSFAHGGSMGRYFRFMISTLIDVVNLVSALLIRTLSACRHVLSRYRTFLIDTLLENQHVY